MHELYNAIVYYKIYEIGQRTAPNGRRSFARMGKQCSGIILTGVNLLYEGVCV